LSATGNKPHITTVTRVKPRPSFQLVVKTVRRLNALTSGYRCRLNMRMGTLSPSTSVAVYG
jgi:hypothetical protein